MQIAVFHIIQFIFECNNEMLIHNVNFNSIFLNHIFTLNNNDNNNNKIRLSTQQNFTIEWQKLELIPLISLLFLFLFYYYNYNFIKFNKIK